jgi:hypothetical protein
MAEIAQGFGVLMSPLSPCADGWSEVVFAARSSAQAFADWAHSKGLIVTVPDVWTVRLGGVPTRAQHDSSRSDAGTWTTSLTPEDNDCALRTLAELYDQGVVDDQLDLLSAQQVDVAARLSALLDDEE